MADVNAEIQVDGQEEPKKNKGIIKLIIIGTIIVVAVAAISFGVAIYTAKTLSKSEPKGDGYGVVKSETIGTTMDAGEYITNLNTEAGDRFIKVKIVFAFGEPTVQEEITNKLPEIQHTINSILRQQTPQSLTAKNAMEKLAEMLKERINSLLVKGNITSVYFTSFVIQ